MLSSKALRLAHSAAPSRASLISVGASRMAPSLTELFNTSLRLSSTPSCQQTSPQCIKLPLSSNAKIHDTTNSFRGTRYFSSKSNEPPTTESAPSNPKSTGNQQHETWVEFQKSISVTGFETGQTIKMTTRTKKRGGTIERKRREREEELDAALKGQTFDITTLKGGEYPPLRFSDEETQRLLAEAYANLPPRAGKRATRYKKREKRRWWIKRMYDAKKKHERMAEHERRMAKRQNISKWIHEIQEGAEEVKARDRDYQNGILERWAQMNGYAKSDITEGRIEQNE